MQIVLIFVLGLGLLCIKQYSNIKTIMHAQSYAFKLKIMLKKTRTDSFITVATSVLFSYCCISVIVTALLEYILILVVTGPAKLGTDYTPSHNRRYLSAGIECLHSVTIII